MSTPTRSPACSSALTIQAGGELVFAHDPRAADIAAVERDCSVIRPHAGHLIFFDARGTRITPAP